MLRFDQTWGSAQVMVAAHKVNTTYYGCNQTAGCAPAFCLGSANSNGLSETGHPGDKWGFVVGAGLRLNFPMVAQGDFFQAEVNYTQGALRYLNMGNNAPDFGWERGGEFGFGVLSDCVFASNLIIVGTPAPFPLNATGCQLTTGWSVNASYEHYWTYNIKDMNNLAVTLRMHKDFLP